jgi:alkylation response protein AidB-like acyl-CoA dehydrogenase
VPGALYQGTMLEHIAPLIHGAVAIGIAEGAINDIVDLAKTGRKQLHAVEPMRESRTLQIELGRVEAELMAARAYLEMQASRHWLRALAGTLTDDPRLVRQASQAGIWVTTTCVRAADACFALGGGSAVYEQSPLQRRLRDLLVASQHVQVQQRHYAGAGMRLLDISYQPEG